MAGIILLPYLPRSRPIYDSRGRCHWVIQFLDEDNYEEERARGIKEEKDKEEVICMD